MTAGPGGDGDHDGEGDGVRGGGDHGGGDHGGGAPARPRVLVPRGGTLGAEAADAVRALGGLPVVAPLLDFAPPSEVGPLDAALAALAAGGFAWLAVTSATTARMLADRGVRVPEGTRVAAVGAATARALAGAGIRVDLRPADESARGLLAAWPADETGPVLLPQSALAAPTLADGLAARRLPVTAVEAYRVVDVAPPAGLAEDYRAGAFAAVLVTSGGVARRVREALGPAPEGTAVAAIGPRTADDARAAGLRVDVVAPRRSAAALAAAALARP